MAGRSSGRSTSIKAGAVIGDGNSSTRRSIIFPGFSDVATSDPGLFTAQPFCEAGYKISLSGASLAGLGLQRATLEPVIGAALIHLHRDGFTENGGPTARAFSLPLGVDNSPTAGG